MTNGVPSVLSVITTLMGVTLKRFVRGRAIWVCLLIACGPLVPATAMRIEGDAEAGEALTVFTLFVMMILPPAFVASSLGEEIEERTTTYLWSRPVPRWAVLVGKLLALAPIAMLLVIGCWAA